MKTNSQMIFLVILYFVFLTPTTSFNHIPVAYSQNQSSSFQVEAKALDDMPTRKVRVGDIDIAYKQFGNISNTPIVLITGCCTTMDMWNPSVIKELSLSRTVIIFDNRGAGETTLGTNEFSINQFANDTIGLLEALKIQKADVFGISMGSIIAQELALMSP